MSIAYKVVQDFENELASWAGAKYGVAVESCCAALFLCLKYLYPRNSTTPITIPKKTYPGVAMAIKNANYLLNFDKKIYPLWQGTYCLKPLLIIDSALRFKKKMYIPGSLYCLSFHSKKLLPIGRGGMILTDDKNAMEWLKMARFDGRKEMPLKKDNAKIIGWNMYMTPEQAARGLTLFEHIKHKPMDDLKVEEQNYPDISQWKCFK